MAEASRRAADLRMPTWIMAHIQTAARGRRGKVWEQPAGNLAATLIYKPDVTAPEAAKRSFMAAIALYETLAIYIDRTMLSLKWPNDVLLNGGKVAGILLESAGRGPFVDWLSVGVGVNLAMVPAGISGPFPPVSLIGEGGQAVSPEDFLTVLAGNYATQEAKLATFGFARIREDWLRHAARIGEVITARTGKDVVKGIFDTVDEDGNLVLITGMGPRAIPAADVFF
jgi:BirA family transcriptional regulator, biotin operon repressor / biotin---[acetyl-CoA-carboxylase] ligase